MLDPESCIWYCDPVSAIQTPVGSFFGFGTCGGSKSAKIRSSFMTWMITHEKDARRCYSYRLIMLPARSRTCLAVCFCSCAVLITEVTLTRIFSVTLMYHYAFLVLSVTLFGLGAGGIFHFVSGSLRQRPESAPWLALGAAITLPACLGVILRLPFLPQLFSVANAAVLTAIVLLSAIPFFLAGLLFSFLFFLYHTVFSTYIFMT